MEDPLSRLTKPLLTDGAAKTNLWLDGMPMYSSPAEWMVQNPDRVQKLQRRFLQAGSQLLCTPTAQANADMLQQWGQQDRCEEYNEALARLTVESCRTVAPAALAAGVIAPLSVLPEPFGETPFFDLINLYARQAFALKRGGVDLLLADTMTTLCQSRAAILGCRQTGLPVMVTMNVEEDGDTCMGSDLVSALITCQKLGVVAFGLSCCDRPEKLYGHIEEMAPYAKVPIIVRPRAGEDFDRMLSPEEMAEQMKGLMARGATILGGCCYTTPEHIAQIAKAMQEFDFGAVHLPKEDESTILMAGATEPYFLDEYFEQTEPVYCRHDMSDELLELEESGADVATIRVESSDDAYNFALNAHMLHMPVSFYSDNEEALEMALLLYNGCAFVDSRSEIDQTTLNALAEWYGATVR